MAEIRILKTVISNVGGIDHLEIDHTSPVIIVTGGNGVGKTSIKQAYELLFDGGHRPDYIKCGQKKAEVLITLSDGITIRRVQTHKTAEYTFATPNGAIVVKRPAEFVQRLVSGLSLNPLPLLDPSNKKKRLQLLQEIMPINFTKPEIDQACGFDSFLATPEIDLEKFDSLLAGQELARRDANTAVREHEGTLSQLKQQLPPDADQQKDWKSEAEAKHLQKERVAAEINRIETRGKELLESQLNELRAERDQEIEKIREKYEQDMTALRLDAATAIKSAQKPLEEQRDQLNQEVAAALTKAQSQAQLLATKRMIETTDQKLIEASKKAMKFDRAIEGLRALRLKKLEHTPIPGLETRDGELYYNGLNFDSQLNRAQQVMLVYRMAARSDRGMNFFVMDDAEHLEASNREAFAEACKEGGFQLVLMAVEEGKPLTIEAA
jgi:hypothetical protein